MKTKYSPILQIKKDVVSNIERQIIALNALIAKKEREIEELKDSIKNLSAPKTNLYGEFLAYRAILSHAREIIALESSALAMIQSSKIDKLKEHKKALIEYEKINYLHVEENKRMLQILAKREQRALDDLSAMTYKNG